MLRCNPVVRYGIVILASGSLVPSACSWAGTGGR
jgi:hypothetical protein